MIKIALIAVNELCENREEHLINYITTMTSSFDIQVIDFTNKSIDDMIKLAKAKADRTIIVFDAIRGMNASFAYAARKLYEEHIHPILLISNSDSENVDISSANTSLAEIWCLEDPSLESWDLNFHNIYFSYNKMGIDTSEKVETDNIDALIKIIL